MKLAILTSGFKPVPAVKGGAVEQLVTDMIEANEENHQYDIDLYTLYDRKLRDFKYKNTNLIMVRDPQKNFFLRILHAITRRTINRYKRINYVSERMASKFKRNYYDIILVENNMDTYELVYKLRKKEKIYFHLHNDFDNGDAEKTKERTIHIINTATGILVVSNYLERKLKQYGARNVKTIYNFVNDNKFKQVSSKEKKELRKKYGLKESDVVFSYIGRLDKEKGIDKLLEAMVYLTHNKNIKCLVIGNSFFGSQEESEYSKALRLIMEKVNNSVVFTGYIDNSDVYKFYAMTDCVVIPTQVEEAFGMVALEAMRMKKPVIATQSGALPEILSSEGSIIVKKNDVYSLAKAMAKIAADKELRKQMGQSNYIAGEKFAHNKYEYFSSVVKFLNK